jgi:hypothetical protein
MSKPPELTQEQGNAMCMELFKLLTNTVNEFFEAKGMAVEGDMMHSAVAAMIGASIHHAPAELQRGLLATFVKATSKYAGIHTQLVEVAGVPDLH